MPYIFREYTDSIPGYLTNQCDTHSAPYVIEGIKQEYYGTYYGTTNRGFFRKKTSGIMPVNPYTRMDYTLTSGPYNRDMEYTSDGTKWCVSSGDLLIGDGLPYTDLSDMSALIEEPDLGYLVQKAAANAWDQGFDVMTFIGEYAKLRSMVAKMLNRLFNLLTDPSTAHGVWRMEDMADKWMEGRYGWRPFLMEAEHLGQVIARMNTAPFQKFVRGKAEDVEGSTWQDTYVIPRSDNKHSYEYVVSTTRTQQMKGYVFAELVASRHVNFNPLVTGWELVPLSFVVDWVLSIGHALKAISFNLNTAASASGAGMLTRIEREVVVTAVGPFADGWSGTNNWSYTALLEQRRRLPVGISNVPKLQFKMDDWKVLDLLAIWWQRIR